MTAVIGVFSFGMIWILAMLGISIYGLVLAFSASIGLGILAFFIEPSPLIFGLVMLFGGVNLPEKIMKWYHSDVKVQVEVIHDGKAE